MLNLCEGNVFQNSFKDDGYFGSSSHNTLFRNVIPDQIALKHFCNYYNVVGNILGATRPGPRQTRTYEAQKSSNYWNNNVYPIYELGFPEHRQRFITTAHLSAQQRRQIITRFQTRWRVASSLIATSGLRSCVMVTSITLITRWCGIRAFPITQFRTAYI